MLLQQNMILKTGVKWHMSAETCRGSNLIIVFLHKVCAFLVYKHTLLLECVALFLHVSYHRPHSTFSDTGLLVILYSCSN
jgi:hypothetical protein